MQRADPLSVSNGGDRNATKSPENPAVQSPEGKAEELAMVSQRNDVLEEEEVAAQLSSIAYSNIKDTEGKRKS